MPSQWDPLMKKLLDCVIHAMLALTDTLGSDVMETTSLPSGPSQSPWVYGTYTDIPSSLKVEDLKNDKYSVVPL